MDACLGVGRGASALPPRESPLAWPLRRGRFAAPRRLILWPLPRSLQIQQQASGLEAATFIAPADTDVGAPSTSWTSREGAQWQQLTPSSSGRILAATVPAPSQPHPAHTLTTSPELRRRRQEQLGAAQDLTRTLVHCATLAEAKELYAAHGERLNAIHWSALFSALARLASTPPSTFPQPTPPSTSSLSLHQHHPLQQQQQRPTGNANVNAVVRHRRPLTNAEQAELRSFVAERLVPHVGLRLMGLAPRQLTAVLAALAALGIQPPAFWMAEWLQHFGRRLEAPTAAPAEAGAPPPSSLPVSSRFQATSCDLAQAMWSLARLRGVRTPGGAAALPDVDGEDAAAAAVAAAAAGASHDYWGSNASGERSAPASGSGPEATRTATTSVAGPASASSASFSSASSSSASSSAFIVAGPSAGTATGPNLIWLDAVAAAFAARAPAASSAELTSYLWAAARLGYRPPDRTMAVVLWRCETLLAAAAAAPPSGPRPTEAGAAAAARWFGPRELCGVLWALATLGFNPGSSWLAMACAEVAHMAGGFSDEGAQGGAASGVPVSVAIAAAAAVEEDEEAAAVGTASARVRDQKGSSSAAAEDGDWWNDHFSAAATSGPVAAPVPRPRAPARRLLDARQASTCAWALARLGHHPDPAAMHALLRHACSPSAAGAGALRATTAIGSASGGNGSGGGGGLMRRATAMDLSMLSFALGVMGFRPQQQQAAALLTAMVARMDGASSQDLVVWVSALSRLRLAVPTPWAAAYLRCAAPRLESLPPLALVNWLEAMASLRTAERAPVAGPDGEAGGAPRTTRPLQQRRQWVGSVQRGVGWRSGASAGEGVGIQGGSVGGAERMVGRDEQPWVVAALPFPGEGSPTAPPLQLPTIDAQAGPLQQQQQPTPSPAVAHACGAASLSPSPPLSSIPSPSSDSAAASAAPDTLVPGSDAGAAVDASVLVRSAASLLHPGLLVRLARLTAARLPALDLDQTCRLAWAAARLRVRPAMRGVGLGGDGGWVDSLVSHSMAALEKRLAQAQPVGGAGASGSESKARVPVVALALAAVDADLLVKLVWSVAVLQCRNRNGLHRDCQRRLAMRRLRQQQAVLQTLERQQGAAGAGAQQQPAMAAAKAQADQRRAVGYIPRRLLKHKRSFQPSSTARLEMNLLRQAAAAAKEGQQAPLEMPPHQGRPSPLVRRRWCGLLLAALLPQLPSLSNQQLLRLVHGLAALYGGGEIPLYGGGGTAAGSLPPLQHRHMAAQVASYCRRRVEATCGGDDGACDLTTGGLLRWTQSWERSSNSSSNIRISIGNSSSSSGPRRWRVGGGVKGWQ